ncbi:MAG: RnfABCDGE type electron transport complex subunit D, partial [Planctomycetes bacterium]|nr:RnfABCDGE type electron transport complex subunit D [Planctomycetota bacterium]
ALLKSVGTIAIPPGAALLVNFLAGGGMFAITFMTTEPVSAPMHKKAIWIYGILIGLLAATIRTMSAFNAGFMFSILLANMFGPIIEMGCKEYDAWKAAKDKQ